MRDDNEPDSCAPPSMACCVALDAVLPCAIRDVCLSDDELSGKTSRDVLCWPFGLGGPEADASPWHGATLFNNQEVLL